MRKQKKAGQAIKKVARRISLFDRRVFPIFSIGILIGMIGLLWFRHVKYASMAQSTFIVSDLNRISRHLLAIDKACSILSISYEHTHIDFLTVEKFVGSEIGGLNLAYPHNWQGPYEKDNPNMQGRVYEVVRAADGYFIVPGMGVRLPNNKVMGVDVVISSKVAAGKLLKEGGDLWYRGTALGRKIDFVIGDWTKPVIEKPEEGWDSVVETLDMTMTTSDRR